MAASRLSLLMLGAALGAAANAADPSRPSAARRPAGISPACARAMRRQEHNGPRRPSIRAWPDRMGAGACRVGPAPNGPPPMPDRRSWPPMWPRPRSSHWPDVVLRCAPVAQGQVSCASCHAPERAFTDGRPLAVGEDGSWDGGAPRRCTPRPSRPGSSGTDAPPRSGTSDGAAARSARDEPRRGRRGRPARRIRVLSRPVPARIWRSARTGFASRRRPHVVRAKPATRCHLRGARAGLSDRCRPAGARAGRLRRHPAP